MYMFYNVEKLQPAPVKCKLEPDRIKAEQQRLRMRRNGFIIIASEKPSFQQTIDEFADLPVKTIYSMWRGYITPGSKAFNQVLYDFCKAANAMEMHTSGHAYKDCIEKVIEVVAPSEEIRFIHTEAVNEFADLNICQELKNKVRWE